MTTSVNAAFIAQYSNEVTQLAQQHESKLLNTMRVHRNVGASTYNFHRMASVIANTKTRDGDLVGLDATSSQVTATLADFYASFYIDKLDQLKTNANMRQELSLSSIAAINRKIDDTLITELATSANTTATVTGGLTMAKVLECLTFLNNNDVPDDKRFLIVGAKQVSEALAIQQLTSTDYVQVQSILNSGIGEALGFKWIRSSRATAFSATGCYAYNGDSVGVAVGQDPKTVVAEVPHKAAWLISTSVSLGAKIIDPSGVTKMTCV